MAGVPSSMIGSRPLVGALVVTTVIACVASLWQAFSGVVLVWCAIGVSQSILVGQLVAQRRTQRRAERDFHQLSGRLLAAQERERRRIACELHDNVSQLVALLGIEIDRLAMMAEPPHAVQADSLRGLRAQTAEIATEIYNLSHQLHSAKLETLGLVSAVQGHCRELLARGVEVRFEHRRVPPSLPYEPTLCLFRIAQEGLTNVAKHSGAREARLTLSGTAEGVMLTIEDAGRGFDEASAISRGGLGLVGMQERLRAVGGELTIRSRSGFGTTIGAYVPLAGNGHATPVKTEREHHVRQRHRLGLDYRLRLDA